MEKLKKRTNGINKRKNYMSLQLQKVERLKHWIRLWLEKKVIFKNNSKFDIKNASFHALGINAGNSKSFLKDLISYVGYSLRDDILNDFSDVESFCWRIVRNEPVAIVGMSCRFPGADNISDFWDLIKKGGSGIRSASERWDLSTFYNPNSSCPGTMCSKWGGFIKKVEEFDADFFRMSPREAAHLDPRQRIMLELSWEALEDAGIPPLSLENSQTSVYVSTLTQDYAELLFTDLTRIDGYSSVGTAHSIVANRISYILNLNGPSIAVDTACSGGLVAIKLAVQSIQNGESPMALVGGVMLNLIPDTTVFFTKAGALSVNGRCKTFDENADGIVRSDGAGVLILKSLTDAISDKNRIHAIIRGGDIKNDGQTKGIMQPSQHVQEILLKDAYFNSDISPLQVQYIEAHGTATKVGDPIEMNAIATILGEKRKKDNPCMIGSVKSNIGHMEAAAGFGGIIKAVLAIKHRNIPQVAHFEKLNSAAKIEEKNIYVQQTYGPWPNNNKPLIAGISSFGFGGTNAHVVIEEPIKQTPSFFDNNLKSKTFKKRNIPFHLFTVSARSKDALADLTASITERLKENNVTIDDLCYSLNNSRSHLESRLAMAVSDKKELMAALGAIKENQYNSPGFQNYIDSHSKKKLAMIFSGQGSHWPGMGSSLYKSYPVFRKHLKKIDAIVKKIAKFSVVEEIFLNKTDSRLDKTEITQLSIFSMQISLAHLWESLGVVPDAVAGHSLGEIAAAYVAGTLSLKDAATVVFHRSRLMKLAEGKGKTLAVNISRNNIDNYLKDFGESISWAGSNSPTSCILSGDTKAIEKIKKAFDEKNIFCQYIKGVNIAFHSHQMEPLKHELCIVLGEINSKKARIPIYSTVTGKLVDSMKQDASYWGKNLRNPFLFPDAFNSMLKDDIRLFLEVSPHPVLAMPMQQCLDYFDYPGTVFSSMRRYEDNKRNVMNAICQLYTQGYIPDWKKLTPNGKMISLPHYPWQRKKYWFDQVDVPGKVLNSKIAMGAIKDSSMENIGHPLLGTAFAPALDKDRGYWQESMSANSPFFIKDHKISGTVIVPGAAYLEMAITAGKGFFKKEKIQIDEVHFKQAMPLQEEQIRNVQVSYTLQSDNSAKFQICSKQQASPNVPWTVHAEGIARMLNKEPQKNISILNETEKHGKIVSANEHYTKMLDYGLEYGEYFKTVDTLFVSSNKLFGYFKIPESLAHETRFNLNPVLMDAAFQSVIQMILYSQTDEDPMEGMYLPVGVKHIKFFNKTAKEIWCLMSLTSTPRKNKDASFFVDIRLVNNFGESILEGSDFKFDRVDRINTFSVPDRLENLVALQWEKAKNNKKMPQLEANDSLQVLFADPGEIVDELKQKFKESNTFCVTVQRGDAKKSTKAIYYVNPENQNEMKELVQKIFKKAEKLNLISCNYIFMWGNHRRFINNIDKENFQLFHKNVVIPLIYLVKWLSLAAPNLKNKLWVLTHESVQVAGPEKINLASSLWGVGNVISNEHPDIWGGWIDLDSRNSKKQIELIAHSFNGLFPEEKHIAIRNNVMFVQRLAEQRIESPFNRKRFKANATYLITGGFGGLGFSIAKWMVENGAARFLFVGRTHIPPRFEWNNKNGFTSEIKRKIQKIRDLESSGASVHTISADISDPEMIFNALNEFNYQNWPEIKGVIHAAGVLRDNLIINMKTEDIKSVTSPKILGSWNLHKFFQNKNLEFFLMFSSISSIIGMNGQVNYAMGNAFMDSLAHYRNHHGFVATSINWGPWAEVGMAANANLGEQHNAYGIHALSNDEGLRMLSLLKDLNPKQSIVAKIEWNKWKKSAPIGESGLFALMKDTDTDADYNEPYDTDFMSHIILLNDEERLSLMKSEIAAIVGKTLRINPSELKIDKDLTHLGLDSLAAVQIQANIKNKFMINIPVIDLFKGISVHQLAVSLTEKILKSTFISELLDEIERISENNYMKKGNESASISIK